MNTITKPNGKKKRLSGNPSITLENGDLAKLWTPRNGFGRIYFDDKSFIQFFKKAGELHISKIDGDLAEKNKEMDINFFLLWC